MTFNGTWRVYRNENYENFLEQMGVNIMIRWLAANDNLEITIRQNGDTFHVKQSNNYRTQHLNFSLGDTFDHSLANGTQLSGSFTLEGDMMKGTFTRRDNGKQLITTRIVRGGELIQTYSYDGVTARRIFKRV